MPQDDNNQPTRLNYKGKDVDTLTREELLVAIQDLFQDYTEMRDLYFKSEQGKIGLMEDIVTIQTKRNKETFNGGLKIQSGLPPS